MSKSKKYKDNLSKFEFGKEYHLDEAVDILHSFKHSAFDSFEKWQIFLNTL